VESLAGEWFEEQPWTPGAASPAVEYSPCAGAGLAQDKLEPILRDRAAELGADVRLGTEMVSFSQDDDGVHAVLRTRDGDEYAIRADYLIGADGHRSPVREALGIQRGGRGYMSTSRSVLFRASLEEYRATGVSQFVIDQPELNAFLTTYADGRWVLFLRDDIERDLAEQRAAVLRAIGRSDLDIELITTGRWEVAALIAEKYSAGRVFLAGDAAHVLPPNRGAYGVNTGIEDAHNLAWKLAAVLAGSSAPELLDTYEAERRPIAWLCHDQMFARMDGSSDATIIDDRAMAFGYLYRSAAVLGASAALPPAALPDEWAGQPGTRAPHLWLPSGQSTLDLFQRGWVLLTESPEWSAAVAAVNKLLGIAVDLQEIHVQEFGRAYGLSPQGATLVRPDGYIAWRSQDLPTRPADALAEALRQVAAAPLVQRAT
jgi:putative polyketide hydroxylase